MSRSIVLLGLALVFSAACQPGGTVQLEVRELLRTSESWNGERLPEYLDGTPEITILKVTIPPNTTLDNHKHPVISAGVLLKGELEIATADGDRLRLNAGDAISEVVNTWHSGTNVGTTPAEVIVFYAGTRGSPNTVPE